MALTVETGSGVNNANSFASLAEFSAFLVDQDRHSTATDEAKTGALMRAFIYMEGRWAPLWIGQRASTSALRASWPRVNAETEDGRLYTGIPAEVKRAQMLLAAEDLDEALAASQSAAVSSVTVGPISETYADPGTLQPERRFPLIERSVAHLLRAGSLTSKMVRF